MRRVIKVGGSLLVSPNLPCSLSGWLANQDAAENLVLVGGGELVDAIRKLDRIRPGDPVDTHWLCVELMETTRRLFADWFNWRSLTSREELLKQMKAGFPSDHPTIVAVRAFYDRDTEIQVPLNWQTTSDTIAAMLAVTVNAEELVLLKSCEIDRSRDLSALCEAGIIDSGMSTLADKIPSIRVEQLVRGSV
jgi:aspartokinase-like uncharacterized kinase